VKFGGDVESITKYTICEIGWYISRNFHVFRGR